MKIQIEVTVFKPSGKYYTEDYAIVEAAFYGGEDTPLQLDHFKLMDSIREYFTRKGQYKSMILFPRHDLLLSMLLMPECK